MRGPGIAARRCPLRTRLSARRFVVTLLLGSLAAGAALAESIPTCKKPLGSVVVLDPDIDWWSDLGLASPRALLEVFVDESGCFTRLPYAATMTDVAYLTLTPDLTNGIPGRDPGVTGRPPATDGVGGNAAGIDGSPTVSVKPAPRPDSTATVELTLLDTRSAKPALRTRGTSRASSASAAPISSAAFSAGGAGTYVNTPVGRRLALAFLEAYRALLTTVERQKQKES